VVLDGSTASVRWQQRLSADWRFTAQAMQQRLKSDDRTAFPYGVYDDPANYGCSTWCDRYAPDGSFTYWQYVSDNERRTSTALSFTVAGEANWAGMQHAIETGVLVNRQTGRFQDQIFDIAGTGNIDGGQQTAPSPGGTDANVNRTERSTELFARDAMRLNEQWQLWAGVRHSLLDRAGARTSPASDGLRATRYDRSETTPWLALAYQLTAKTLLYASWGEGLETDVAPNRSRYNNGGQSFALRSRQWEAGIKHGTEQVEAALTLFDIDRGQTADIGACAGVNTCTRVIDGSARHRGVEAQWALQQDAWSWQASAMLLEAQRRGSPQSGVNGNRPVNVPTATLRLGTEYLLPHAKSLALLANLSAESNRVVLPYDESVRIAGWTRLDLGARWRQGIGTSTLTWRVGVDNATDRRAWKESPYQFGHVYLYPLPSRTWRGSVQATF
jgi:iron complex outermembrane receptor protein